MNATFLKRIAIVTGLGIFGTSGLIATENTATITSTQEVTQAPPKEEKKFPGKLGLEAGQTFQTGNTKDAIQKTTRSEDAFYSKTELKAKVDFKLTNFYTITPWVKNRLDVYGSPAAANTANIRIRDRFDTGFDNIFDVKNIIKITLTPAFRLDSDFKNGVPKLIFMPSAAFGYQYACGLRWEVNNILYFFYNPANDAEETYEQFCYEGKYNIKFDIFKAAKIKKYGLEVFAADNVELNLYSDTNAKKKDVTVNESTQKQIGDLAKNEFTAGVSAKFAPAGIMLTANYYQKLKGNVYENYYSGLNQWNGLQLTGEFGKENWTIGIQYTGDIQTWKAASASSETQAINDYSDVNWENTIEAYFKLKL